MARTTYTVPLNGSKVAIGPFPFKVRSITPVNKCQNGNLIVVDDRGAQYVASAQTADTYAADDTTYATAYIDTINITGSLAVIVSDEEPTNPVNNAQLSTLSGGGSGLILARVTSLPTTPIDAQAVVYAPDQVNYPGVEWWLVYNTATGYWDVIGGTPLQLLAANNSYQNSVDNTWQTLAGVGSITVPNQGDYTVTIGCNYMETTNSGDLVALSFARNGVNQGGLLQLAAKDNSGVGAQALYPGGERSIPIAGFAAGEVLAPIEFSAPHANVFVQGANLAIMPKRIK